MKDLINLLGQFTIERGAHCINSCENVATDHLRIFKRLLRQGLNRNFNAILSNIICRLELLLQKRLKIIEFADRRRSLTFRLV